MNHFKRVVRAFLLVAADRASCYDELDKLVALPAVIRLYHPRTFSKFNIHCLAQPAHTPAELKEIEIEEEVFKTIEK